MVARSGATAANGQAKRPKGTRTPRATKSTHTPGGVETAMTQLVTDLRTNGHLSITGEVTAAQAIAAARALDQALTEGNAYGCRQAHVSLTESIAALRAMEPLPGDPMEALFAQLTNAPTT
jgi:hypothetical protein